MSKKKIWMILYAAFAITANAVIFIVEHNWSALLWLLFGSLCIYVISQCNKSLNKCYAIIKDQSDYIEEADEHIHYLTNHDTWKQIRMSEAKAQNCYHYLMRIGRLKAQIEQLKILNKNLIENKNTGVRNYARTTRR